MAQEKNELLNYRFDPKTIHKAPRSDITGANVKLNSKVTRRPPVNSAMLMSAVLIMGGWDQPIGYIQEFTPTEGRNVNKVWELGNEEMVEINPGSMETNTIHITRMLLYRSRLIEMFDGQHGLQEGYNQASEAIPRLPSSLLDYNVPFEIDVYLTTDPLDAYKSVGKKFLMEAYMGCWFTKISYTVRAGTEYQIIEDADVAYTWKKGNPLYGGEDSPNK